MSTELRRKAYDKLLEWKHQDNGSVAIMIDGAKGVGKSHLAKQFGENEYRSYVLIDFSNVSKEIINIFENDSWDLDFFFNKLSVVTNTILHKRNSLIIFDEVQNYPRARELIKIFVEDGRYDYIETGSFLHSIPKFNSMFIPSEEEVLYLHPLDFEEFLWALGKEIAIPYLKNAIENLIPLGQAVHTDMMNAFRQYIIVGGMPQSVVEYVNTKDLAQTERIKILILESNHENIAKHSGRYEAKVEAIFNNVPSQLSKREKKFILSSLEKSARMRSYERAFFRLADGRIINQCFNVSDPSAGLSMSLDDSSQKCYMFDTGLLVTQAMRDNENFDEYFYKSLLMDKLNVNEGMFMENIVAQMLRANGYRLFFFSKNDKEIRDNNMEIDFLIRKGNKIHPLEVKSSVSRSHISLDRFVKKYKSKIGQPYILCPMDITVKEGIVYLPLYMTAFL